MSRIHYFNPGHENAVLNRTPSYTAPASLTTLMSELSSLPMWYASTEDKVFVYTEQEIEYRELLVDKFGFVLPKLITNNSLHKFSESEISMWGITPHAIRVFDAFNKGYDLSLKIPTWNEKYIYLNSRKVTIDILSEIKAHDTYFDYLDLPIFCDNLIAIDNIVSDSSKFFLAKAPYSSSGRGLLWLPNGKLTRVEQQILNGIFNKQKYLVLERAYDKVLDFALEFMSDGKGNLSIAGYSLFETSAKGAYQGNLLLSQTEIEDKLTQYIDSIAFNSVKVLLQSLLSKYYGSVYSGCIGVDMMIIRENNIYKIHPCVEVNMRYNMGYLSLRLFDNFIDAKSRGHYFLDFDKTGKIFASHQAMQMEYPLVVENGRVKSGYLSLCPVVSNTKYRAYVLIED